MAASMTSRTNRFFFLNICTLPWDMRLYVNPASQP
jgi:hypothetical protein